MKLHRRDLLLSGAAATLASCSPKPPSGPRVIVPGDYDRAQAVTFAPAAIAQSDVLFPLGVQAGAIRPDGALLWTRVEGGAAQRLRVWRDAGDDGTVQLAHESSPTAAAYGTVHAPVRGLAPATWYHYGFFDEDLARRSPLGRFRTAFPFDWKEPLRLGATSCTNFRMAPYVALSATAKEEPDLFVHLGDISYNDPAKTTDEFRALWTRTLQDPGYRDLLTRCGWYAMWDDHELENNLDPETADPTRLRAAIDSFYETIAAERGPGGELWRSYTWGGTAELFILDCRTERKPSTIGTPEATYLSRAQMDWLKGALKQSGAHFKVICNSVPITLFPPPLWGVQNDRWQAYEAQREELLSFIIDEPIDHVLFLSGDFHLGLVMRVEKTGQRRRLWELSCGPGGNSGNPLSLVWESPENREIAFPREQFAYCGKRSSVRRARSPPAAPPRAARAR